MATRSPDVDALIARAGDGDELARQQLLAQHRARLRRMVAVRLDRRLSTRVDPSDVVQETLAVAARRLDDYLREPGVPFYPWLRGIAWDRLIEAHRRHVEAQGRSIGREERWVGLPEESAIALADRLAASGTSPSRHLLREELRRRVRAALDRLKEQDREILALRHLEGLSPAEAAAVLDVTERAAKARHIRALARIRALLEDEAGGTAS